ncbi:MAG: hypothetical protein ACYS8W_01210 [Planctomycetota bacterium]|jgi:hypothetical protein
MTHIILFIIISAATSFACTLIKTREPAELWHGSSRFFVVLIAGIFVLGLIIQVTQSLGGIAGIICILIMIGGSVAYHYVRPKREN